MTGKRMKYYRNKRDNQRVCGRSINYDVAEFPPPKKRFFMPVQDWTKNQVHG